MPLFKVLNPSLKNKNFNSNKCPVPLYTHKSKIIKRVYTTSIIIRYLIKFFPLNIKHGNINTPNIAKWANITNIFIPTPLILKIPLSKEINNANKNPFIYKILIIFVIHL